MDGIQGGPNVPSPTLADLGKGRFRRGSRTAIVERFDGVDWREIGRYGSVRDAGIALDEAIGGGADPGSVRVVEAGLPARTLALLIVGGAALLGSFAFAMYALFG